MMRSKVIEVLKAIGLMLLLIVLGMLGAPLAGK